MNTARIVIPLLRYGMPDALFPEKLRTLQVSFLFAYNQASEKNNRPDDNGCCPGNDGNTPDIPRYVKRTCGSCCIIVPHADFIGDARQFPAGIVKDPELKLDVFHMFFFRKLNAP